METDVMAQVGGSMRRLLQVWHSLPMGGLPMGEFLMLQLIRHRMEKGAEASGVYVSELTQCVRASPPAVSRTLRRLEEKGLAQRKTDPKDRRTTYVVLTDGGRALLDSVQQQMESLARRVEVRMGADELRALAIQLDRLSETVQEEREKMSGE